MIASADQLAWHEPLRSPENIAYQPAGFVPFMTLLLRKAFLGPTLAGAAIVFAFFSVVGRKTMAIQMPLVVLACGAMAWISCSAAYLLVLSTWKNTPRKVVVDSNGVACTVLQSRVQHLFNDIDRVVVEPLNDGEHRMILFALSKELCRIRIPSTVDLSKLQRLIPEGKLAS